MLGFPIRGHPGLRPKWLSGGKQNGVGLCQRSPEVEITELGSRNTRGWRPLAVVLRARQRWQITSLGRRHRPLQSTKFLKRK